MRAMREQHRVGADYLKAVTELLQRMRSAHPTKGMFEAAEIQFWWSTPRWTDKFEQLFWFDDDGRPEAAAFVTDFGDGTSLVYDEPTLVLVVMPEAAPEWVEHVLERGLAHIGERGIEAVELEVDQTDDVLLNALSGRGFAMKVQGAVVEAWLNTEARPEISPLSKGYRLLSRVDTLQRPHHMTHPKRPDVEQRLQETSLYRPDLDLFILDAEDNVAAHGLCWYDPVTATGVVEPMRTADDHQRRGLARHILTSGVELLARAGVKRVKIGYEPDNPASSHLYLNVGFEPVKQTDLFAGRTKAPAL